MSTCSKQNRDFALLCESYLNTHFDSGVLHAVTEAFKNERDL
jgi:hypothetical protein